MNLNCRGDLLAGHASAECCLDTVLRTLGVCFAKWVPCVLPLSITVDQAERIHHLKGLVEVGFLRIAMLTCEGEHS